MFSRDESWLARDHDLVADAKAAADEDALPKPGSSSGLDVVPLTGRVWSIRGVCGAGVVERCMAITVDRKNNSRAKRTASRSEAPKSSGAPIDCANVEIADRAAG